MLYQHRQRVEEGRKSLSGNSRLLNSVRRAEGTAGSGGMGHEAGLAQAGIPEVKSVLLGVGGIRSLALEASEAGGSQDDSCLGKKSSTPRSVKHLLHPTSLFHLPPSPPPCVPQCSLVCTTTVFTQQPSLGYAPFPLAPSFHLLP